VKRRRTTVKEVPDKSTYQYASDDPTFIDIPTHDNYINADVADVPSQADETPLPWSDLWKQYLGD
jgi:hypothetical protein